MAAKRSARRKQSKVEQLVEAQARGERVQGVPTEGEAPQDAELDERTSKGVAIHAPSDPQPFPRL